MTASVDQMRALGSPVRVELFERIAGGATTATALAEAMQVPVTRLYHHLRVLVDTGLIEVASTQKKRGMTERSYRLAVADVQLDPASLVGEAGHGGPGRAPLRAAFRLAEAGLIGAAGDPAMAALAMVEQDQVRLSRRDAARFRQRLVRLFADLRKAHRSNGTLEVRLTVALSPEPRQD